MQFELKERETEAEAEKYKYVTLLINVIGQDHRLNESEALTSFATRRAVFHTPTLSIHLNLEVSNAVAFRETLRRQMYQSSAILRHSILMLPKRLCSNGSELESAVNSAQ